MKKIIFKTVPFENALYGNGEIVYKNEIENLLLAPANPQAGTGEAEMRQVMPIYLKMLAEKKDYIILEDAEHNIIADRFSTAVFKFNSPEIFLMINDIRNAEEYALKEVEAG